MLLLLKITLLLLETAGDNCNAAGNVAATLSVKVVTTSAEAKFNASTHEADQANFDVAAEDNFDAAGDNCNAAGTAAAGAKATAGKANVELKATVVTVDAPGAKFKATSTADPLNVQAKFITADGPEAKLMDSTSVQQPPSDMDSAVVKLMSMLQLLLQKLLVLNLLPLLSLLK